MSETIPNSSKLEEQKPKISPETDRPLSPEKLDEVSGGRTIIVRNGDPCDGSEVTVR